MLKSLPEDDVPGKMGAGNLIEPDRHLDRNGHARPDILYPEDPGKPAFADKLRVDKPFFQGGGEGTAGPGGLPVLFSAGRGILR